jgi:hypothetical protein
MDWVQGEGRGCAGSTAGTRKLAVGPEFINGTLMDPRRGRGQTQARAMEPAAAAPPAAAGGAETGINDLSPQVLHLVLRCAAVLGTPPHTAVLLIGLRPVDLDEEDHRQAPLARARSHLSAYDLARCTTVQSLWRALACDDRLWKGHLQKVRVGLGRGNTILPGERRLTVHPRPLGFTQEFGLEEPTGPSWGTAPSNRRGLGFRTHCMPARIWQGHCMPASYRRGPRFPHTL